MSGVGLFDLPAIRQSCWQSCDADPGAYPADLASLPAYRDDDTRQEFFAAATFFGCVDLCEGGYAVKRAALVAPLAVLAAVLLATLASCWFCKGCALHKARKSREKHRLLASSTSLDLPPATAVTNDGYDDHAASDPGGRIARRRGEDPPSYRSAVEHSRRGELKKAQKILISRKKKY